MAKREGNRFVFAEVGKPIPGEHALDANDQAGAIGGDGAAKGIGVRGQIAGENGGALLIEDMGEHTPCVQVDAAIECVRLVVEAHGYSLRRMSRVDPASWLPARRCRLKDPRRTIASALSPFYL